MKYMSFCYISFVFLFMLSIIMVFAGFYFIMNDLMYFIEWEIVMLNSNSMNFIWLNVFIIYKCCFFYFIFSYFYSEFYMYGDLNLNRFIYLVLLFDISMLFLIISPNLISIFWDETG